MGGASALGYEQMPLRAFIFVGVGNNFATKWGAVAGILAGAAVVTYLTVMGLTLRPIFPSLGSVGDISVGVISARERRRPRCRQPRYPHHDDHGQGRGIPRSRSESFAPRTFVTWPATASFKKSRGLVLLVRERETRA